MKKAVIIFLAIVLASSVAVAQCGGPMGAAKTSAAAPASGSFKANYFEAFDHLEKETVALAEAAPQEKYSWRPAEGVRSVGEVFMHMAGGNYSYARMMGATIPSDINPREFEKSAADKAKTVATLKKSFDFLRQTVQNLTDADMAKAIKIYGKDSTVANAMMISVTHQSEHLGQSIAYARDIGVVPPWTAERQASQAAQKPADPAKK
jgi:uncharacterized damage-inducible protein DinB